MAGKMPLRHKAVGQRIGGLRREASVRRGYPIRQQDAAEAIGVKLGTWTAWETGRQLPDGANLLRIAEFLSRQLGREVTPGEVLTGEPGALVPPPTPPLTTVLRKREALVGLLEGVTNSDGEAVRRRRRDILSGYRQMITAAGEALPTWYYDLEAWTDRGGMGAPEPAAGPEIQRFTVEETRPVRRPDKQRRTENDESA